MDHKEKKKKSFSELVLGRIELQCNAVIQNKDIYHKEYIKAHSEILTMINEVKK